MTPSELQSAVDELFPVSGKGSFADALGVDPSTQWRYQQRGIVPGPVVAAVNAWLRLARECELSPPSKPGTVSELDALVEMARPGIRKESGLSGIEAAAFLVFGAGWKKTLYLALGVDASTLWRQIVNDNVSGPVMAAVRAWVVLRRLTDSGPLPEAEPAADNPGTKPKPRRKRMPTYARLLTD